MRPPAGPGVTETASPPANAGSSTRAHVAPSGDTHATAAVGRWTPPTTPTAMNPPWNAVIARTSAFANATGSSATGCHVAPSADVQKRAWRSSSSGPDEPPATNPLGPTATAFIRSATRATPASPGSPSLATSCACQLTPSVVVHDRGRSPNRPTATTVPSAPAASETGYVNAVLPTWRNCHVRAT